MKIVIDPGDVVAQSFFFNLGAKNVEGGLSLSGGGSKEVICWSSDDEEMPKKEFSIQDGKTKFKVPEWCPPLAEKVVLVLNKDRLGQIDQRNFLGVLNKMTKEWEAPKKLKGRGGSVVYEKFLETGRVITSPDQIPNLENAIVMYGTSDLANVFELFQVIKAAEFLGIPGIFDTYSHAYSFGDYWKRVLGPSLTGFKADLPQMGGQLPVKADTKYYNEGSVIPLANFFGERGLGRTHFVMTGIGLYHGNLADAYRIGLEGLAVIVAKVLGIKPRTEVVTTESLLSESMFSDWRLGVIGDYLEERLHHSVVVANLSNGAQLKSGQLGPYRDFNIDALHGVGGWVGGSVLYAAMYSLGRKRPIVMLVKDSKAGEVHKLARPFLTDADTYLLPVELVRLSAPGQDEDASIDPFVLMEMFARTGWQKEVVQQIFNAIELPLKRENIGQKTLMTMSLDGLSIKKVMDY